VAVLHKDRKATAEFVERFADGVYRYPRARLLPRPDPADDLFQETFLAAWEHLAEYRGESPLESWLLGIARHKVEDYYRSRLREAANGVRANRFRVAVTKGPVLLGEQVDAYGHA
jgi:RNA polymerase sigma-70 factor, ECF subfamily